MRNLKRALSLALASVMLLGMMVVGSSAASFPDVDSKDNVEAIEVAKAVGIMEGDDNGNFNPDTILSRVEMAALMTKLLGLRTQDYAGTEIPFTDVPAWGRDYVAACYANDLTSGTSKTTFGSTQQTTAVEVGLMIMKALGYFQFQEDYGDSWVLAAVKQASKIGLFKDVDAGANTPLNRNQAAQLVLNGLKADMMDYSGSVGTKITTTDGTEVNVGYTVKYDVHVQDTTGADYNGDGNSNQQLCEKLYGKDLTLVTASDAFGRVCRQWKYKANEIGKYAKDADATYTKKVTAKTIYNDLGMTANIAAASITTTLDGQTQVSTPVNKNDETSANKVGDRGVVTTIYTTKTGNVITALTIAQIKLYYGKVSSVGTNSDGDRVIRVGGLEYKTEGFAKDDTVIYTIDKGNNEIKSVTSVEKQTGTITKIVGSNDYYIDGQKYTISVACAAPTVNVNDKVDFYVDENGYIAKLVEAEDNISVDNLAYVEDAGTTRGNWATLRLSDGTKLTVDTDKNYTSVKFHIVSYKENKDGYKLTNESSTRALGAFTSNYVDDATTMTNSDGSVSLNDKTVFLYRIINGTDSTYKVYTGYKNAPAVTTDTASKFVAYTKDGFAEFVYVEGNTSKISDTTDDMTIVVYDTDVNLTKEGDGVKYYEYAAVVDGEVTTLKVDDSTGWTAVSANGYGIIANTISKDSDDIATNLTLGAGNTSATGTKVSYKSGVVNIDGTGYGCEDDVVVVVANKDLDLRVVSLDDIETDNDNTGRDPSNPYVKILASYKTSNNKLTAIILFEN